MLPPVAPLEAAGRPGAAVEARGGADEGETEYIKLKLAQDTEVKELEN